MNILFTNFMNVFNSFWIPPLLLAAGLTMLLLVLVFFVRYRALQIQLKISKTEGEKYKELFQYAEENKAALAEELIVLKNQNKSILIKINYELRTAMNAILGMANLLAETELTKKQKEFIAIINDYSKRCLKLTDEIFNNTDNKSVISNERKEIQNNANGTAKKTESSELSTDFAKQFPLKILVAEDDKINQVIAAKMFEKIGYKPDIVNHGKEALEIVSETNYDIIFMDIQMPVMDGKEATKMIRLCLEKQPIIIAITASVLEEDKDKCIDAGMNDFITKPLLLADIASIIQKWTDKKNLVTVEASAII